MSKIWGIILVVFLMAVPVFSQEGSCNIGVVDWRDATIYLKRGGLNLKDIDNMTTPVMSFGCIAETEKTLVIIHSFVGGQPEDYLVVPKEWATKVTYLTLKEEKDDNLQVPPAQAPEATKRSLSRVLGIFRFN
jgi:hypothetical protein